MVSLDGFFVVDKPRGPTSHDVVARVRRAAGRIKVGHAGTLDPLASGVLVVCVGRATRLADDVAATTKRYRVEIVLGVETDTYDAEGTVIAERPVAVLRDDVEAALERLSGAIAQLPPMYSAIKVGGRKLYDLARAGEEIERAPRHVVVDRLDILAFDPPRVTLDIVCSKGTYVRSIAHDLGVQLETGAHVDVLVRTASGRLELDDAVPLDRLVAELEAGRGEAHLLPMDTALVDLPAVVLDEREMVDFRAGRRVEAPGVDGTAARVRVYGGDGILSGLARAEVGGLAPTRVFAGAR